MENQKEKPRPYRECDGFGWEDHGPRNFTRDLENPDLLVPPPTDSGTVPNLRFSFSDAHMRLEPGGWAREITNRELAASTDVAGVNMALEPGAFREMHWHKEAEWGLMLYGNARVCGIDEFGRTYADDVVAGDLWNFEAGIPHSIEALDMGCEFLLVFSEADFSENNTFLLTDWLAHTPKDIVAANFKKSVSELKELPKEQKYIFKGNVPGPLSKVMPKNPLGDVPSPFTYHMKNCPVIESEAGRVRIVDINQFPASQTISAAFVEVEPGGMRELHWHPKAPEWQYYIQGQAKMSVFDSNGTARTFDFRAGDVGIVPMVNGHYIQNTGTEKLIFVEVFKYPVYSDISLNKWLVRSPRDQVAQHLNVTDQWVDSLPQQDAKPEPVVWYKQPEK